MSILGFIPARGGSRGLPGKNIRPLNGKPLLAHTIEVALRSRIDRLILSTDSEEIASVGKQAGAEVPFLRPEHLASDTSVIEDALIDLLQKLKETESYEPEVIVLLHPTTPLRKAKDIDGCILKYQEGDADSVLSVSEPMEHPGDMVSFDGKGKMHFLLKELMPGKNQRQEFPDFFFINGCVYVFSPSTLRQYGNRYGQRTVPYIMPQRRSIDIDTEDDFLIAEALLKHPDWPDE